MKIIKRQISASAGILTHELLYSGQRATSYTTEHPSEKTKALNCLLIGNKKLGNLTICVILKRIQKIFVIFGKIT